MLERVPCCRRRSGCGASHVGSTWSRERLTSKQTTSRPDNVWPDMWKHVSDASKRKETKKDARTIRREQDCGEIQANGDELDQFCCFEFFICEQSDCVEKPGDTQKLQVNRLDYQGGLMQTQIKIPIPTQRRVLEDGKEMLNCSSAQGNLWQW